MRSLKVYAYANSRVTTFVMSQRIEIEGEKKWFYDVADINHDWLRGPFARNMVLKTISSLHDSLDNQVCEGIR